MYVLWGWFYTFREITTTLSGLCPPELPSCTSSTPTNITNFGLDRILGRIDEMWRRYKVNLHLNTQDTLGYIDCSKSVLSELLCSLCSLRASGQCTSLHKLKCFHFQLDRKDGIAIFEGKSNDRPHLTASAFCVYFDGTHWPEGHGMSELLYSLHDIPASGVSFRSFSII